MISVECFTSLAPSYQQKAIYEALLELTSEGFEMPISVECFPSLSPDYQQKAIYETILAIVAGGGLIDFENLDLSSLPTSDPGGGKPWLNGGALQVGP